MYFYLEKTEAITMRKVLAAVLILAVAITFAACSGKNNDPSQTASLSANLSAITSDTASNPYSQSAPVSVSSNGDDSTIVLTTAQGETAPSVVTTAFVPDPAAITTKPVTATPATSGFNFSAPPVVTSQVAPVNPVNPVNPVSTTQDPTSDLFADRSTTAKKTTTTAAPTSAATRSSKSVVINDIATTSDKKMIVTINSNGWDGKFKSNSQTITVKVDGEYKSAPCSISSGSSNADGFPYITIDLSNVSVPEGANVQFTVPSAFLQTSSGSQYSSAFSGSYTMM